MTRTKQNESAPNVVRCAIYTRKSTEEGLDQEFNTLDAQRESGEAYVRSQQHEGWECALLDASNCRAMFCHTPWYADLIRKHRGPANQSEIIRWPYPIDPWPGEPLPDEYDLLIYAKNGHRPQLLEHLAEAFPRHIQIHYGQFQREELFEAARRSRACAYLADDDHGPLALQEILLTGCPTVGVRTGASLIQPGATGLWVERLPPGRPCVASAEDEAALEAYLDAIHQAQSIDRAEVRCRAAEQFATSAIVDSLLDELLHVQAQLRQA